MSGLDLNKNISVLAVGAHPDDIEFSMSGTLCLLKDIGCRLHYFNLANGCCGTVRHSREEIVQIREAEARAAAEKLAARYYPSIVDDFSIFYSAELLGKVAAVVRRSRPRIILLPSLDDYMEDHIMTARLTASAAFVRHVPNYTTIPPQDPMDGDVVLYHALPHGLKSEMRRPVKPELFVDISDVINRKADLLACHRSQKDWLDVSQGFDSYLETMKQMSGTVGRKSGRFEFAEGWTRHSHLGYSSEEDDPLFGLLASRIVGNGDS